MTVQIPAGSFRKKGNTWTFKGSTEAGYVSMAVDLKQLTWKFSLRNGNCSGVVSGIGVMDASLTVGANAEVTTSLTVTQKTTLTKQ